MKIKARLPAERIEVRPSERNTVRMAVGHVAQTQMKGSCVKRRWVCPMDGRHALACGSAETELHVSWNGMR